MDQNTNQIIPPASSTSNAQQQVVSPEQNLANPQQQNTQVTQTPNPQPADPSITPGEDNPKAGTKATIIIFIMLIVVGLLALYIFVFGRNLWK